MRYGYRVDEVLGVILIVAPYGGNFMQDHTAAYTEVIIGILLLVWAVANYLTPGRQRGQGVRPSQV